MDTAKNPMNCMHINSYKAQEYHNCGHNVTTPWICTLLLLSKIKEEIQVSPPFIICTDNIVQLRLHNICINAILNDNPEHPIRINSSYLSLKQKFEDFHRYISITRFLNMPHLYCIHISHVGFKVDGCHSTPPSHG